MQPNPNPPAGVETMTANLHRQIELEQRLSEQLRGVREYQASLLRQYSAAHGFCVPLTIEQFKEYSRRAA